MEQKSMPCIREYQGYKTLMVEDAPFVILGGELHNSAASDSGSMEQEIWPNLKDLGMNAVVAPVYWECIEPEEDVFDFDTVDFLLKQARREGMRLVLLWFGLWKNAESMYAPGWMKRDKDTYFVCRKCSKEPVTTISPLCEAAVNRDKKAFSKLMDYLKNVDSQEQTVIMVQVENEIGLLGTERDYSPAAEEIFAGQVPAALAEEFQVKGSWQEAFGEDAGEYFMAWAFAKAVEEIAGEGKKAYPLPMYVNAWLEQFPWRAGTYPSGGPVMKMKRVWKKTAPSLFTMAPDIYVPSVPEVMEEYSHEDNPLFVPEVRKDAVAASYALYAVFGCHGIGFSPFGIEELRMDPEKIEKVPMEVLAALNIDPTAFDIEGSGAYLKETYELIAQLLPLYYSLRQDGAVQAFVRKDPRELGAMLAFENYDIKISYSARERYKPEAAGVVFQTGADEFYLAGMMGAVEFCGKTGSGEQIEIVRLEEGSFEGGVWKRGRILNGDEKMRIAMKDMPAVYRVETLRYR